MQESEARAPGTSGEGLPDEMRRINLQTPDCDLPLPMAAIGRLRDELVSQQLRPSVCRPPRLRLVRLVAPQEQNL